MSATHLSASIFQKYTFVIVLVFPFWLVSGMSALRNPKAGQTFT